MATIAQLRQELAQRHEQLRTLRNTETQRDNLGGSDEKRIWDRIDELKRLIRGCN